MSRCSSESVWRMELRLPYSYGRDRSALETLQFIFLENNGPTRNARSCRMLRVTLVVFSKITPTVDSTLMVVFFRRTNRDWQFGKKDARRETRDERRETRDARRQTPDARRQTQDARRKTQDARRKTPHDLSNRAKTGDRKRYWETLSVKKIRNNVII